jgi:porin
VLFGFRPAILLIVGALSDSKGYELAAHSSEDAMNRSLLIATCIATILSTCAISLGQGKLNDPNEDIEVVVAEAQTTPQKPVSIIDRPIYSAVQDAKAQLLEKYGFSFAIEDTLIYQGASGGVDPQDAMVNTLGLFATWKIFRSQDGKDFAGIGFQFETRGNPLDGHFTDMTASLGTIWSPNDSTSNDYTKINQLWWGQRFADGRLGFIIGKIDPGAYINGNRFAGSGNTQFFGQPFATNPARSFSDNGLGLMLRADPTDWFYAHFTMSDSDAVSTYSPFKTLDGHWLYAGEIGFQPVISRLGKGVYRLMFYGRDTESADEVGWSLSCDQNLTDAYGVFLRYGGNDGTINAIRHLVSTGISFLKPFGRRNDQAGIGVSYTHPTNNDLRDEYSTEVYYRLQVTEGFELSGSTQLIVNPSASPQNTEAVFGLRARLLY